MDIMETIKEQINSNAILLYMKGSPDMPQCGFSAQSSQALMSYGKPFAFVNVLEHPEVRENLKVYSNWPTFPQLYINGELIGGCDIIMELQQSGELETLVNAASEGVTSEASKS